MIAAFSPDSDFKRYYRGRMPRLAVIAILLMPLLYGALYLWAFWNPFGNVDKIPTAIVNLDEGAELKGDTIDAGPKVVSGIVDSKQLDIREVSEEEGASGLEHGHFAFTITVPADFSESIVSAATGDPRQADLIFTYNDANNYLDTVIGQDAAEEVINQVTAQVSEQVFEAALSGVEGELPKVRAAAGKIEELNTGMGELDAGAQKLAAGLVTAEEGSAKMASAIDEIVDGLDGVIAEVESAVANDGLSSDDLRQIVQSIESDTDTLNDSLNSVASANDAAHDELQGIIDDLRSSDDPDQQAIAERLASVQQSIENSRIDQDVTAAFDAIHDNVSRLADDFDNPNSGVNVTLRAIESGAFQSTLNQVTTKADELRSGADQLESGLVRLRDGGSQIADNTPKLAEGTTELVDGVEAGMKLIPHWSGSEQQNFVKVLADPVVLKEITHNEAKTFAYGFAPFFFGLALFVGGILAWMVFTPLQARPLAQGLGSFRVVTASYAPALLVGFVQATILFLVVRFALGMEYANPWGTYGFMLLMVAMFLAMIQMFNALFGPAVGRVVTLAFLMVQLTSAGGVYPVPVTTLPFQYIHWIDPMTATVTGLRFMILGGSDYRLLVAIGTLVALTVVFIAISTLAARRNRQYNMDRLYPPVEV
ncbi:YhgE/Pip domain-containing protein [Isoptericola halotolerans]|uniref:YhgE/Pip family protein n=1 Tax=Isoptericola halotolerans TaxID=300560 RepID=UPI0038909275